MKFNELAKVYNVKFGFNVLRVQRKKPIVGWENWQLIEQNENDIEELTWNSKCYRHRRDLRDQ